jgi:hypothetical protein
VAFIQHIHPARSEPLCSCLYTCWFSGPSVQCLTVNSQTAQRAVSKLLTPSTSCTQMVKVAQLRRIQLMWKGDVTFGWLFDSSDLSYAVLRQPKNVQTKTKLHQRNEIILELSTKAERELQASPTNERRQVNLAKQCVTLRNCKQVTGPQHLLECYGIGYVLVSHSKYPALLYGQAARRDQSKERYQARHHETRPVRECMKNEA